MSDAVVTGLFAILAALIGVGGGIIVWLLSRNYKQGQEIHVMVNGELTRTRHQVEVLTKQLDVYKELGIIAALADEVPAAPSGEVHDVG